MAKFFKVSSSIDLIETEELLLRKYNIDYILRLDFEEGFDFIKKAFEKDRDERLWEIWLINYKSMNKDTFINFEDFKKKVIGVNVIQDTTSKEELLEMAKEIEDKISQRKEVS